MPVVRVTHLSKTVSKNLGALQCPGEEKTCTAVSIRANMQGKEELLASLKETLHDILELRRKSTCEF